ncbi:MAG: hypothetical protein WCC22_02200 [Terriglobales bacterium]
MRLFLIFVLLFSWLQNPAPTPREVGKPQQQHSGSTQEPARADQRGTEQSPLVVKTLPPVKTQAETGQETEDRKQKAANDGRIVVFTGVLALIALGQLGVYLYQAIKLRATVKAAGEQSQAMERHIGEAARSATAMENIATVIQSGNAAVLRAYMSVVIGSAVFQDRQDGLKFEGKPNLVNTGSTPARNVRIRIAAEIVPVADAENFPYSLPEEVAKASAVAAPHQTYILSAIVKDFVPDNEVVAVKGGEGKALTVWGVVTYDDIFGQPHTTKFAQWLFWYPNNTVYGYYIPGQNDMD